MSTGYTLDTLQTAELKETCMVFMLDHLQDIGIPDGILYAFGEPH